MDWLDHTLTWMKANHDLSGWAQAAGAMIAIVFAIGVPAFQRHTQSLDMRRQRAELDLALSLGVMQLLTDADIFLKNIPKTAIFSRDAEWFRLEISDLLKRIQAMENREHNQTRLHALFHARGALLATNFIISRPDMQQMPLEKDELESVDKYLDLIQKNYPIIQALEDKAIDYFYGMKLYWPARWLYFAGIYIANKWRKLWGNKEK